jgi:CRP-like cAMP-binding protein
MNFNLIFPQEYCQGTVLEEEGTKTKYIYLILKGEVSLMRKPENLYDKKSGKMIKVFSQL